MKDAMKVVLGLLVYTGVSACLLYVAQSLEPPPSDAAVHQVGGVAFIGGAFIPILIFFVLPSLLREWTNGLFQGVDGKPSTSLFQFYIWTIFLMWGYCSITMQKCMNATWAAGNLKDIPSNALIAMGLSGTTLATSTAITVGYVSDGRVTKGGGSTKSPGNFITSLGELFLDDSGKPDLAKTQMLAWTLIGIVLYAARVFNWDLRNEGFPDIDGALMVLMGLSQGTYIGKKLATTDTLVLLTANPPSVRATDIVTLKGSMGSATNGIIRIDGEDITVASNWTFNQVSFLFPDRDRLGQAWKPGQQISVSVATSGKESNPILLQIATPTILSLTPPSAKVAAEVTVGGVYFSKDQSNIKVSVGGASSTLVTRVSDAQFKFTIPAVPTATATPTDFDVVITMDGFECKPQKIKVYI